MARTYFPMAWKSISDSISVPTPCCNTKSSAGSLSIFSMSSSLAARRLEEQRGGVDRELFRRTDPPLGETMRLLRCPNDVTVCFDAAHETATTEPRRVTLCVSFVRARAKPPQRTRAHAISTRNRQRAGVVGCDPGWGGGCFVARIFRGRWLDNQCRFGVAQESCSCRLRLFANKSVPPPLAIKLLTPSARSTPFSPHPGKACRSATPGR